MKNTPTNRPWRRSPEQWRELIEHQRAGKQSARAFCQARGIAYSTFPYHKRKLRETAVDCGNEEAVSAEAGGFIELNALPEGDRPLEVELSLGNGLVLRIRRP